jgi:hypothetical protein
MDHLNPDYSRAVRVRTMNDDKRSHSISTILAGHWWVSPIWPGIRIKGGGPSVFVPWENVLGYDTLYRGVKITVGA